MKNQRITLHDIASLAGVTPMTVSRYLRTPEKVTPQTSQRIAAVINEIGYQPDTDNPQISGQATARIGVLIPSFHNQIFPSLLAGIEAAISNTGYKTVVVSYDYDPLREEEQIAALLAMQIKGIILTESVHTLRAEKYLKASGIPVAEVMGNQCQPGRICVGFDNQQAGFDMTRLLLARGKKQIIYFGAMSDHRDRLRYSGYCEAMQQAGLRPGQITPNKISSVSVGNGMMGVARQKYPQVDGILCTNDDLAVGVLQECLQAGIQVPAQLSIAGFHGLEIGQVTPLKLASVITPRFAIGKTVTEIMLRSIAGQETPAHVDLHYQLSCGETL
ncbi:MULTISPECIES: LacI family DNA-binding transcriptional regulator [unclassified Tatumella]|uniref:LacI family DNA-binding transcriptional regulator n=1 Tax=unclassified Tatumella TaxID=2649542 RepID=UPI001BAEB9D6|nr:MULTISPECIES: LacI family DNA-binding transcriptional regulator [unclassified Tatumella]MBS0855804.1 LacI family DNA-binding transcriptional regulator [Tatumella sp. JGM16]MBS0894751.1 LacI family DNA-binding transcriptional regulator [Tatumella sp. JGM130]MBS0912712.1 LacI family DNA-binding transcriptional regulator [Tatumella sp. JGM91]